jgi:hypothetical protein
MQTGKVSVAPVPPCNPQRTPANNRSQAARADSLARSTLQGTCFVNGVENNLVSRLEAIAPQGYCGSAALALYAAAQTTLNSMSGRMDVRRQDLVAQSDRAGPRPRMSLFFTFVFKLFVSLNNCHGYFLRADPEMQSFCPPPIGLSSSERDDLKRRLGEVARSAVPHLKDDLREFKALTPQEREKLDRLCTLIKEIGSAQPMLLFHLNKRSLTYTTQRPTWMTLLQAAALELRVCFKVWGVTNYDHTFPGLRQLVPDTCKKGEEFCNKLSKFLERQQDPPSAMIFCVLGQIVQQATHDLNALTAAIRTEIRTCSGGKEAHEIEGTSQGVELESVLNLLKGATAIYISIAGDLNRLAVRTYVRENILPADVLQECAGRFQALESPINLACQKIIKGKSVAADAATLRIFAAAVEESWKAVAQKLSATTDPGDHAEIFTLHAIWQHKVVEEARRFAEGKSLDLTPLEIQAAEEMIELADREVVIIFSKLTEPYQAWEDSHQVDIEAYLKGESHPPPTAKPKAARGAGNPRRGRHRPAAKSKNGGPRKKATKALLSDEETIGEPQLAEAAPLPAELSSEGPPESKSEERPLSPVRVADCIAPLLARSSEINSDVVVGSTDAEARGLVRKRSRRSVRVWLRQLAPLLDRWLQRPEATFDYDEVRTVIDCCRRILEASLTLAVARHDILIKGGSQHVIAASSEPLSGMPRWGHDLQIPAALLCSSPTAVPKRYSEAIRDQLPLVRLLSTSNQSLHYAEQGRASGRPFNASEELSLLLSEAEKMARSAPTDEKKQLAMKVIQQVVLPTLHLAPILLDEREEELASDPLGEELTKWLGDRLSCEQAYSAPSEEPAKRPTAHWRRVQQLAVDPLKKDSPCFECVRDLKDAERTLSDCLSLLESLVDLPVHSPQRAGRRRRRVRNGFVEDAARQVRHLHSVILRAGKTDLPLTDCHSALHAGVRALRAIHLAALVHLPLWADDGCHLIYGPDAVGSRRLTHTADILLLNRLLLEVPMVKQRKLPDLGVTSMEWLRNAHNILNNPAYQLAKKEQQSELASCMKRVLRQLNREIPVKGPKPAEDPVILIETIKARFLFPSLEILHALVRKGFPTCLSQVLPGSLRAEQLGLPSGGRVC